MAKYPTPKLLNLAEQAMFISKTYNDWKCLIKKSQLICEGRIKPTEISLDYLIRITYKLKQSTKVKLIYPPLQKNVNGERAPHLYPGGRLCIYHPRFNEWDGSKVIAYTIIPWTALWLYYYEVWLITGEWKGGGEHPPKKIE